MPSLSTAVRRLVLAACLLSGSILSAAVPTVVATRYPPVEQATFHQLQFADADVAVLKNVYPPHSGSGFHLHSRELFYVVITAARFGAQKPGGALRMPATAVAAGSIGYNVMTAGRTRSLRNTGTTPIEIIEVELK